MHEGLWLLAQEQQRSYAEYLSCLKLGFASLCLLQSNEKAGKRGHGSKSPSFMATHKTQSS